MGSVYDLAGIVKKQKKRIDTCFFTSPKSASFPFLTLLPPPASPLLSPFASPYLGGHASPEAWRLKRRLPGVNSLRFFSGLLHSTLPRRHAWPAGGLRGTLFRILSIRPIFRVPKSRDVLAPAHELVPRQKRNPF
ncbi:hypothetical protein NDU88_002916 [Pleurodeles waltl]|uniref:Uncharacterized protein n=1 Tax=Pleurodeles waltl TaxID=8319 RepID=A0AAV7TM03_PLEWA|nr:hypothetical protein NDU88_002916 [Pleurodeles waltl]